MASKRDSRVRVIQLERGRTFVVWFGGIYVRGPDVKAQIDGRDVEERFRPGDEVELCEGSTSRSIIIGAQTPAGYMVESGWIYIGTQGGKSKEAAWARDWDEFLRGLKSNKPRPIADACLGEKNVVQMPEMADITALARQYEASSLSWQHEATDVGVSIRFRARENATSFRLAAARRVWAVSEVSTDPTTDESVVVVKLAK